MNFANPTGFATNVLWNFIKATNLTFSGQFGGTVLAPFAAVANSGPIEGTLAAASYSGNGYSPPFRCNLLASDPVAAPEPASLALLCSGLAGLVMPRGRAKAGDRGRQLSCRHA